MIKYNSNTINDWYYGTSNLIKVYHNGSVCYQKMESGSAPPTPPAPSSGWTLYHSGDTIPQGYYGGVRLSSATSIGYGTIMLYFDDDGDSENAIEFGYDMACLETGCTEYECYQYDEETGECIEYGPECIQEDCIEYSDGYVIRKTDELTEYGTFTYIDGYWTFTNDGNGVYSYGNTIAEFDIELLVTN